MRPVWIFWLMDPIFIFSINYKSMEWLMDPIFVFSIKYQSTLLHGLRNVKSCLINKNHLCGTFLCHSANNFTFVTCFLSICFLFSLTTNKKNTSLKKYNFWKPICENQLWTSMGLKYGWFNILKPWWNYFFQIFETLLHGVYNLVYIWKGDKWKPTFQTCYDHFDCVLIAFNFTNELVIFQHLTNKGFYDYLQ